MSDFLETIVQIKRAEVVALNKSAAALSAAPLPDVHSTGRLAFCQNTP